ncbi:MAG: hemerythrin domain-containing protein [Blastomonas sp.]
MAHSSSSSSTQESSLLGTSLKGLLLTAGAMTFANLSRKLAVQAPTAMAPDWCDGLAREHKATLAVLQKLEEVSTDHPHRRTALLTSLTHMISKHALQEENVIYPMLRRKEGDDTAGSLNSDHGAVKAILYELAHMDKSDPGFADLLGKLRGELENHMREEEDELFPALRQSLSDEENTRLTREMNMAGLMLA